MKKSYTFYESLRSRGVSRRDFLRYCGLTAVALGLGPMGHAEIAHALQTKPRLPVLWINGLSCSCCTESFIRTSHPLAQDIILQMISLDYQDTLMAPSGKQANECFEQSLAEHKGEYILAVEGNAPLGFNGMCCIDNGKPFLKKLYVGAEHAKAIIAWGNCASWGCVQNAHPNPSDAKSVRELIHNKPVINIPGCPPIPNVMSGVLSYILTFNRLPQLDAEGRPQAFYGKRVHDQCVRRAHFDAGQFVESWDDPEAKLGLCLYKMGCKGPTTYNACPITRWNEGTSYPIQSGHGCIGCSEQGFWDRWGLYDRVTNIPHLGVHATANTVGGAVLAAVGTGVAVHAAASAVQHIKQSKIQPSNESKSLVEEKEQSHTLEAPTRGD